MNAEKEIIELEKNQRLSARSIPIYACMLVFAAVALWVVNRFVSVSIWITIIVVGLTAFTLLGDIYNYFYCCRKLRRLKRDHVA
jgi:intracellular septation protein A